MSISTKGRAVEACSEVQNVIKALQKFLKDADFLIASAEGLTQVMQNHLNLTGQIVSVICSWIKEECAFVLKPMNI